VQFWLKRRGASSKQKGKLWKGWETSSNTSYFNELRVLDSKGTPDHNSDTSSAFTRIYFHPAIEIRLLRTRLLFLLCSNPKMTNRPASWRMPTPKQMEKLASEAAGRSLNPFAPPDAEYWDSVLKDARAGSNGREIRQRRLSEISRHAPRVSCRRCERVVEIQTIDAVQLYGGNAVWKDVGRRLLDDTCQQRTGRYEEDGCWPGFEAL
jgi:hypothetical protein